MSWPVPIAGEKAAIAATAWREAALPKNIFAFTDISAILPGYISVNERDDGEICVSVRSQGGSNCSEIVLPRAEFYSLSQALQHFVLREERT